MGAHLQRLTVPFEYPVVFTRDLFAPSSRCLVEALSRREARQHRLVYVVDRGVVDARPTLLDEIARHAATHAGDIALAAPPLVVTGGEAVKNDLDEPLRLLRRLHELGIDRHSFVVAVGGGAVLDMVGYAAAIAHRGVRHVRVPTTVLSQADSGVGVKNGVNAFGKKNFLGVFAPPHAVLIDGSFLRTLPVRERSAGLAEVAKVALVRDRGLFALLLEEADHLVAGAPGPLALAVERSARLHLAHIASGGDPFERGSARPLDFGHWAAHRLETLSLHRLRHGEAVAIGIALDAFHSVAMGLLDEGSLEAIVRLLDRLGLPLWDDTLEERDGAGRLRLLAGLDEFREHLGGELSVTLLEEIGRGVEVHAIDGAIVERAVAWLAARRRRARSADGQRCA